MFLMPYSNFIVGFTSLILVNILSSENCALSKSLNKSEIQNIFQGDGKATLKKQNFAEGGLVRENTSTKFLLTTEKLTTYRNLDYLMKENVNISTSESTNLQNNTTQAISKVAVPTKLIDAEENLLLGAPEVYHINGTSSIKPRKGVGFPNKIVPRKGVNNDNKDIELIHYNSSCSHVINKECSNFNYNSSITCYCCKSDKISLSYREAWQNCSTCNFPNIFNDTKNCQYICCENVTHDLKITKNLYERQFGLNSPNNSKIDNSELSNVIISNNDSSVSILKEKDLKNSAKLVKLKPVITKVPYDIDNIKGLVGSSKKEILLPITASLILLPLIGILLFFTWRKTKEFWDKRYYKRMDFLIDGMYND